MNQNTGPMIQGEEQGLSLVDLVENVFYFRWYFIGVAVAIFAASILYALVKSPVYTADVLIQVEEKKGSSLGALSQVAKALDVQQSPVQGEIEIIRSRNVIGRAADNLKANIEITVDNRLPLIGGVLARALEKDEAGLTKPLWSSRLAWGGEELRVEEFVVPQQLLLRSFYLRVEDERQWELFDEDMKSLGKGQGKEALEAMDGKLRFAIHTLKARPGTEFKIRVHSIQSWIRNILTALNVTETKRQSSVIKITYEDKNPQRASNFLNAVADAYVQQNIERRSEEAEKSLVFLRDELPKLKKQLEASEDRLNAFRNEKKTIDITGEIKELLDKATQLEKSRLELELKRKEFTERYEPAHPLFKSITSQLQGIKSETTILNRQISQLPQVQQEFIRFARDVEVNNQLYISLLNNSQQLQIAKAGTVANVAIIDRALAPEKPSRPNKPMTIAVGGLLGLLLGFLTTQLLALMTRIVRDPKKLELATGKPIMAILPLAVEQLGHIDEMSGRTIKEESVFLLAKEKPNAATIEALRSLRTSLLFSLSETSRGKTILVTSAVPGQGKSFISANLSYLMGAVGKKVLLIEADIRLASIKRYIDFNTEGPGWSSVLKGEVSEDQVILHDVYPNMDFLQAGPRVRNPGDLLSTERMQALIHRVSEHYDIVIIDSPPLLPVNDAREMAKAADLTVFVTRQDAVSMSDVDEALDIFAKSGNQIAGFIFNGFVPSQIRYGYRYGYGYGKYGKYGKYAYGSYDAYRSRRARGYGQYGQYGDASGDGKDDSKN
jgi:tyrosine-protein kinase Etk/Wzc